MECWISHSLPAFNTRDKRSKSTNHDKTCDYNVHTLIEAAALNWVMFRINEDLKLKRSHKIPYVKIGNPNKLHY